MQWLDFGVPMFKTATKSTRRLPSLAALLATGLVLASIGVALLVVGGKWIQDTSLSVSDFLMLAETGPRLGVKTRPSDIVLVHYGEASAKRLGTRPFVDTDRKVYKNLLDAGAKAVADPRAIAALLPEDFESNAKPTLEMMSRLEGARGRLVRDVMLGSMVDYDTVRKYDDFIRHDSLSFRSANDSSLHSRICPIADHDLFVLRESMTLWMFRHYMGLDAIIGEEVKGAIDECGLTAFWLSSFPQMATLLGGGDTEPSPSPISIGDRSFRWMPYPGELPQVAPAGFWIDHTLPADSFTLLDYGDVAEGDFDASIIKDRLVVIGLDLRFVQSEHRYRLPSQQEQVGNSVLLALAGQTLIDDRVMRALPTWGYLVPLFLLTPLCCWLVGRGTVFMAVARGIGLLMVYVIVATIAYRSGWFTDIVVTPSVLALAAIVTGVGRYGYEIRWRNRMTDLFGRYVPRAVVNDLISKRALESIAVGGTRRSVTVLFADIRGFTRFTEANEPEQVLDRLNEFLKVMVDCTFANEGTVDKFIGDAMLVLFNAPTDQPDHVQRALQTAWEIQESLSELIPGYEESELRIGIGIHTGEAIVGNVGTVQRMEYTAIGSTVNVASRLCDRAAGGTTVVSEEVAAAAGDLFEWKSNEPMQVKGIEHPLLTMTLVKPVGNAVKK